MLYVRHGLSALSVLALFWLPSSLTPPAHAADGPQGVLEQYVQQEYRIPMRDGAELFTVVFTPKQQAGSLPMLVDRSLYMATWPHVPPDDLAQAGYIFVFQDARGTYRSGGTFLELSPRRDLRPGKAQVDESTDTYDTVEWLLRHVPNNNGKVGLYGWSYEGFYVQASITHTHPAIKAADIEIMGDWNYHHGVLMLGDNFEFYIDYKPKDEPSATHFKYWTRDAYAFFLAAGPLAALTSKYFNAQSNPTWADLMRHDTFDDYWKERSLTAHLEDLHCAVLNVGGWFDQYVPAGPVGYYHTIASQDPAAPNFLVMGPWNHGASNAQPGQRLGNIDFGSDTAAEYRRRIRLPFFEYYLKGKSVDLPKVLVFETGSNVWREYGQWPPVAARERTLYLRAHGLLSFDPPSAPSGYDQYVSDPAKPVPLMGSVPAAGHQLMAPEYMTADQRFAARRPDVLVYATPPLAEDLTVVGPVTPRLFVSTSGTDSDWVVKLIDVYPPDYAEPEPERAAAAPTVDVPEPPVALAGYNLLVRGESMRGKFRHGWDKPEAFVPGRPTEVSYTMSDVNHTFRKGHRIMVQVQSSMFPLADLNPQTFMRIPEAKESDFHAATQRVYWGHDTRSGVLLHVLPGSR